jgi:shikimate kinase
MRIYLIGFMGSGKSHWGRLLSDSMQVPFYDLDDEIVQRAGKTVTEIFSDLGEEQFREMEKYILEELTERHEELVVSCGGGTPCFFGNIDFMKAHGKVIWLNTSVDTLVNRLMREKNHRPLLRDIPNAELKTVITKKLHDRKLYYKQANLSLAEETLSLEQIQSAILHD